MTRIDLLGIQEQPTERAQGCVEGIDGCIANRAEGCVEGIDGCIRVAQLCLVILKG